MRHKPEELRARAKRSGREECGVNPASSEQAVSPPSQVAPEAKAPDWWEAVKRGLLEFANNWEPDDPAPLARALADVMDELRAKARPNLTVELLVRHVTALESRVTTLEDNYETAHQFAHDFDSRLRVLEASDSLLREIEEGKQRIAESQEQTKAQASPSERLAPIAGNPGCGSERTEVAWVSDAKGTHIVITGPLNHKIECADDCLLAFADGTLLAADETHWTFDVKRKGSSRLSASIDNPYECPSWRIVLDGRIEWLVVTEADNVAERPMDALVFLEDSQPSAGGFPPTGDPAAERTPEPDTASQDPFSDPQFDYIRTEEDRKRFAPKRETDEFWLINDRWLAVDNDRPFASHYAYRRRKEPEPEKVMVWPVTVVDVEHGDNVIVGAPTMGTGSKVWVSTKKPIAFEGEGWRASTDIASAALAGLEENA